MCPGKRKTIKRHEASRGESGGGTEGGRRGLVKETMSSRLRLCRAFRCTFALLGFIFLFTVLLPGLLIDSCPWGVIPCSATASRCKGDERSHIFEGSRYNVRVPEEQLARVFNHLIEPFPGGLLSPEFRIQNSISSTRTVRAFVRSPSAGRGRAEKNGRQEKQIRGETERRSREACGVSREGVVRCRQGCSERGLALGAGERRPGDASVTRAAARRERGAARHAEEGRKQSEHAREIGRGAA